MDDRPLYQDAQLMIDYHPTSVEDHLLSLNGSSGTKMNYTIPRGILEELARTPRGGIERKIAAFNDLILYALEREEIAVDSLHVALCQAYAEQEKQIRQFAADQDELLATDSPPENFQ